MKKQGENPLRPCSDERSLTGKKCRAAIWEGDLPLCTALTDPDFKDGICPFYKTFGQYIKEYQKTNKLDHDPYKEYFL